MPGASRRNIPCGGGLFLDIFEYLLSQLSTAGKNGQFWKPRHIIRMIVELVDPDINDRICDPACGTAGFLVNAYEYVIRKHTSPAMLEVDEEGEYYNLEIQSHGRFLSLKKLQIIR